MADSQAVLSRILRMQRMRFHFSPVPCGEKICVKFQHYGWGATGESFHADLAVAVLEASKKALRHLAAKKAEHMRACKEAATVFTEFNPEEAKI